VIQGFSDLGGSTSNLILKLLLGVCGSPIYHPREFQELWRLPSARPNCWSLQGFRRAQFGLGFQQIGGGRLDI
jgi:hypothetical protein